MGVVISKLEAVAGRGERFRDQFLVCGVISDGADKGLRNVDTT